MGYPKDIEEQTGNYFIDIVATQRWGFAIPRYDPY